MKELERDEGSMIEKQKEVGDVIPTQKSASWRVRWLVDDAPEANEATETVAILSKAVFTCVTALGRVKCRSVIAGKLVRSQRVSRQLKQKWEFYIALKVAYLVLSTAH